MQREEIIDFLESAYPSPWFVEPRSAFDQAIVNFRSVMVAGDEYVVAVYSTTDRDWETLIPRNQ